MANLGSSIIVPSVQELVKQPISKIPPWYARNDQDGSILPHGGTSLPSVPIIDLEKLLAHGDSELDRLDSACRDWGFFQIVNHGVRASLLEEFKSECKKLFDLPLEEKKKLWQKPESQEGFGQLFVVSEDQKLDWSDIFYISTLPASVKNTELFEKLPSNLRDAMEAYAVEMKGLAMKLLECMAKALKMDKEETREMLNDGMQSMRLNYYPPCPEPESAIGLTPHSDAGCLTILYQLNQTEGLQIRKDGIWIPVRPLPGAFVVNVGDSMEIISNGNYRSIEHRATVNSKDERLSAATFFTCTINGEIGPARSLVGPDNASLFRHVSIETYYKNFFARKLNGKSNVDFMRIGNQETGLEALDQKIVLG